MTAALLAVLKVLGWVLLALLTLMVIVLFVPFCAYILYEKDTLTVNVGALGLRFCVFDSSKKCAKKPKEEKTPKENKQEPQPTEKPEKEPFDFELARFLIGEGVGVAGRVLRALHPKNLAVRLIASGEDPCETGLAVGRMWSFVGSALSALLAAWPRMSVKELTVIPDFMHEHEGEERLYIEISAIPAAAVAAAAIFGIRFLKFTSARRRASDSASDIERTCEQ